MEIYKRKASKIYQITWYDRNGKRHRRSSGTTDKKSAEALAAKWVKESFMEHHFGKTPETPFAQALLGYAKMQKRDYGRHFHDKTRYRLKLLQDEFGGQYLSQISSGAIQEFMDRRLDEVSEATAQRDVATLRAILNKAHREGLLAEVPKFPRFKVLHHRTRWLKPDEEDRLVKLAAPHLVPLIRFAADTGGRLSELLELDWREVDLDQRRITFLRTKNGEQRTVSLCNRAVAVLATLGQKECGPVFTYRGQAIKRVKTAFNKARASAGLADVRFHDLRHTFASRLVQEGVPLYEVMSIMGHKSLDMVMRYAHLAPNYQDGAVQALNRFGHSLGTHDARTTDRDPLSA